MDNKIPFGSDECGKFLRKFYADSVDDVVILDDSMYEYIEEYDYLVSEINKLEVMKKAIEHRLQSEMKECGIGFCKERKFTWKSVEKNSLDSKKLKIDLPEVYDKYVKKSRSRVFRMGK